MSKSDEEKVGKPISPEALEAMRHELFFGTPAPSNSGRFKKGQSGNPKGRPKRVETAQPALDADGILATILKEAERKIAVRDGGNLTHISARQALARSLYAAAVKGHPYALRTAIEMLGRGEREEAREIAASNALWEEYCAVCRAEIMQAKRRAEPEPNPLPHPDDIIIEPGKRVRFTGPVDEADAAKFEQSCRLRDTLMMQDALDQKLAATTGKTPGGSFVLADALNRQLPQRMQFGDGAIIFGQMRLEATPKRTLLKNLYQAWRRLGFTVPRGWTSPSLEYVEKRLRFYEAFFAAVQSGKLDVAAMARGEFDEDAREFLALWA